MNNRLKVIALVSLLISNAGYSQDITDDATVVRKARLLAEQGNASAQSLLGMMYAAGRGVAQDYKESLKWHLLAAAQGDAKAQWSLGVMYSKGEGVTQD